MNLLPFNAKELAKASARDLLQACCVNDFEKFNEIIQKINLVYVPADDLEQCFYFTCLNGNTTLSLMIYHLKILTRSQISQGVYIACRKGHHDLISALYAAIKSDHSHINNDDCYKEYAKFNLNLHMQQFTFFDPNTLKDIVKYI